MRPGGASAPLSKRGGTSRNTEMMCKSGFARGSCDFCAILAAAFGKHSSLSSPPHLGSCLAYPVRRHSKLLGGSASLCTGWPGIRLARPERKQYDHIPVEVAHVWPRSERRHCPNPTLLLVKPLGLQECFEGVNIPTSPTCFSRDATWM